MSTIDFIYTIKYTIAKLLLNNPILASDLVDQNYVIALKEPGLIGWKYDDNLSGIVFIYTYDHKVTGDVLRQIANNMTSYFEMIIRDPNNYGTLMQLGVNKQIDSLNESDLRNYIMNAITVLDISATENTSMMYKIG